MKMATSTVRFNETQNDDRQQQDNRAIQGYQQSYTGNTKISTSDHCWTALSWDNSVVDAAGQPLPGPLRFWRETSAALMRAALSAFELPVGKLTATVGLLTAFPAATFAVNAYREKKNPISYPINTWKMGN